MVESSVLPDGAKVGDILKVEATIALDGIEIHSVVPARTSRKEPERIEILGGSRLPGRDDQPGRQAGPGRP